uniref:Small ribosomal subunit protein mS38 n=1 Tax=Leersia perrieri TaxID=77586 RepID=A0A0D9VX85_9ORYZ
MAAAAAPRSRLLLLRLGKPPPAIPIPLLSHLTPQIAEAAAPAAAPCPGAIPSESPAPNLRDVLCSFHPGLQIYPSLDPRGEGIEEEGDGDGAEVWADSVKKKRKRKMNKHKLRKLRKRLRRQT